MTICLSFIKLTTKEIVRDDDYRKLIELSVIFFGGDTERKLKIQPPDALHHAGWVALRTRTPEDYPDCKKQTLKRKFKEYCFLNIILNIK